MMNVYHASAFSLFPSRRVLFLFFWISLLLAASLTAKADLVWSPESGWRMEGEVLEQEAVSARAPAEALELMNEAREAQEHRRRGSALRLYRQVFRNFPHSVFAPEAHFQSGIIRKERRQWNRAFDEFDTIVKNYPHYDKFDHVISNQYQIAQEVAEGARMRLFWVIPGFRSKETAVEFFERVVQNAPYSEYAPIALAQVAVLQKSRRKPDEAIDAYDRLINEYPRNFLAPDAYLGLAQSYRQLVDGPEYDQGATRQAIAFYEDFQILFPEHPNVAMAEENIAELRDTFSQSKLIIGDFYFFRRRNYTGARVFYNEAITASPNSPTAELARQRLEQVEERDPDGTGGRPIQEPGGLTPVDQLDEAEGVGPTFQ